MFDYNEEQDSEEENEMMGDELKWTGKDLELREYIEGLEEACMDEADYVATLQQKALPFDPNWADLY